MISLDLHGSVSPRECPLHVQHFALDLVSRLQSTIVCLSVRRPVVQLPSVMGLCVLTTSLAGRSVRRP